MTCFSDKPNQCRVNSYRFNQPSDLSIYDVHHRCLKSCIIRVYASIYKLYTNTYTKNVYRTPMVSKCCESAKVLINSLHPRKDNA